MLKLVLTDDTNPLTANCFQILSLDCPSICLGYLENSYLMNMATQILSSKDVPQVTINKLATITLTCLLAAPKIAPESCGYLYHLLKYCSNHSVFNLFSAICTIDERTVIIQEWLNNMGFPEYINREFSRIDFKYQSKEPIPYYDEIYQLTFCLYQLITNSVASEYLKEGFLTQSVVDSLQNKFSNSPSYVTTGRWKAINAICCSITSKMMGQFVNEALAVMSDRYDRLYEYQVEAIVFLIKMMEFQPDVVDTVSGSSFPNWMIQRVMEYPHSTILHSAFRKFIDSARQHTPMLATIIHLYTPLFISVLKETDNKVLKPSFVYAIQQFVEVARNNKYITQILIEVPEFADYYNKELIKYMTISAKPYGDTGIVKVIKNIIPT